MALQRVVEIELPVHAKAGGFDHAAVHPARHRLYVAHTANDAVDIIDCVTDRYVGSITSLVGVAGVLVSEPRDLVFTSNRGEDTVAWFSPALEKHLVRVAVGPRPNGLAYDPRRDLLLSANVGDPVRPGSWSLSLVDVAKAAVLAEIRAPGRTRWAVFDAEADAFYVNIVDPPQIVVVDAGAPHRIARTIPIPAAGPHGLDLDPTTRRLFCACDGRALLALDAPSGRVLARADLGGVPDVVFVNPIRGQVYVAIGEPGMIEVFDTDQLRSVQTAPTESGAHTLAFDPSRHRIYAFLPGRHAAVVYADDDRT